MHGLQLGQTALHAACAAGHGDIVARLLRGGADINLKDKSGGMFVVSETHIKYFSPARLDDLIEVTAQTSEAGRASLVLSKQAWHSVNGERKLLAEGTIRIGWVDTQTMKPGRIPAQILEALQ